MDPLILVVLAAAVATGIGWLLALRQVAHWRGENQRQVVRVAEAAVEIKAQQERLAALAGAEAARGLLAGELAGLKAQADERDRQHARQLATLGEKFAAVAAQALDGAQARFAVAADEALTRHREAAGAGLEANRNQLAELIAPIKTTLGRYEEQLVAIEKVRAEGYGQLTQLLDQVNRGQDRVSGATQRLENVLRSSGKAAGRWGEEQCRNVLELAGLVDGVDFTEQTSVDGESGKQRPDFTVILPGDRRLVIDVKCSLDSYIAAAGAEDGDERAQHLKAHAAAVRSHAVGLASKSYEKSVDGAVDFVVLFVPGENFLSAALEHDRKLLGEFMDRRLVLAGPINLIAVARTVAAMRDQARLAKEAGEIARLGRELYDQVRIVAGTAAAVGKSLGTAVRDWNKLVGQFDGRLLSRARKLEAHGVATGLDKIGEVALIDLMPLLPQETAPVPELLPPPRAEAAE